MNSASDFEYGYAGGGIETLLEEVKGIVLSQTGEAAKGELLDPIIRACESNWQGKSRERYVANLKADAETFYNALNQLYTAFESEIRNAGMAYKNFDDGLIEG
jgi:uncharacterized protein YukE